MSLGETLFSFEGRIGRGTFWAIVIPLLIISGVLNGVFAVIADGARGGVAVVLGLAGIVFGIIGGIMGTWIALATYSKRWHDLDRSGWMTLTLLIPLINILIMLYLGFAPGTKSANKYGEAPGGAQPTHAT